MITHTPYFPSLLIHKRGVGYHNNTKYYRHLDLASIYYFPLKETSEEQLIPGLMKNVYRVRLALLIVSERRKLSKTNGVPIKRIKIETT